MTKTTNKTPVYAVLKHTFDESHVMGIYSSQEKAQNAILELKGAYGNREYEVQAFLLDD